MDDAPHVAPYWDWTIDTRIVLKVISRTTGAISTNGTAIPHIAIVFVSPPFDSDMQASHTLDNSLPSHLHTVHDAENTDIPVRERYGDGEGFRGSGGEGPMKERGDYQLRHYDAVDNPHGIVWMRHGMAPHASASINAGTCSACGEKYQLVHNGPVDIPCGVRPDSAWQGPMRIRVDGRRIPCAS